MKIVNITLKGQEYRAKLDFRTLANIQTALKKEGLKVSMQEVFEGIAEQDFAIITEVVVQSILRCHPQIKRGVIESKLDFEEMTNVFEFIVELAEKSMPQAKESKEEGK